MQLINATRMQAGYTMGLEPGGRELLVVVVKGTFVLPKPGEQVRLHDEQVPLLMADTFSGEPGLTAPVFEVDYAPCKKSCDILLVGNAHAPGGRPTTRTEVGLKIGPVEKRIAVVGNRWWEAGVTGIRATPPQPFVQQPISYDVAFGGVDQESADPAEHAAYMPNPVGKGFRKHLAKEHVEGRSLPNTEEPGTPVAWPTDKYRPMSFGAMGRNWNGRREYAGTYDQRWLDERFPFLPEDFDERYFQAAPLDQQAPFSKAPMEVTLENLTSDGLRNFVLPHFEAPVHVFPRRGEREDLTATLDTIVMEPELDRFTMSWRATRPLARSILEIDEVLVGRKGPAWWQQRDSVAFPIPVIMVPMNAGADSR